MEANSPSTDSDVSFLGQSKSKSMSKSKTVGDLTWSGGFTTS